MMSQRVVSYTYMDKELVIELVPIENIRPHEMGIYELEKKITESIRNNGVVIDPIIADTKLGMIIDGTHRWMALKNLRIDYIPTIPTDYVSGGVKLYRWIRIYDGVGIDKYNMLRSHLENKMEYMGTIDEVSLNHEDPIIFIYGDGEKWFCHRYPGRLFITELIEQLGMFEEVASKVLGIAPDYIDEKNIFDLIRDGGEGLLILSYRRIKKAEVVNIFKKHIYLPPKTTRHVVPYRIVNVNIPTKYLFNVNLDKALKFLTRLKIEYLGNKVFVGDRYYEEDIYKAVYSD